MHALIVGGTGMLRGVMEHYRKSCKVVSIIARSKKDLEKLEKRYPGIVRGIPVDYLDEAALKEALAASVEKNGRYDLAVVWMQDAPMSVVQTVAAFVGTPEAKGTLVHIRGSAAADPARPMVKTGEAFSTLPTVAYQEVILGFVVEGPTSRWLDHEEITEGIIDAIGKKTPRTIVGTTTPWAQRPKVVR